jgi:hypothetical protein
MLDVLHYLFESDSLGEKETQDAKRKMRGTLYTQLYDRPYTWGSDSGSGGREFGTQETASGHFYDGQSASAATEPSGAPKLTHKPYIPPTPVDPTSAKPFGNVLDPPIG